MYNTKNISDEIQTQFNDIYNKYHRAVYKNIIKYINNEQIADDIFQEVFISLWECLVHYKEIRSYNAWLFMVSHNKAISHIQKMIRENTSFPTNTFNESILTNIPNADDIILHENTEEQLALLHQAIDMLPLKKRKVFCLNKFEGKSIEEISQLLDMTPLSVKEYIKQSTRSIKTIIEQNKEITYSSVMSSFVLLVSISL